MNIKYYIYIYIPNSLFRKVSRLLGLLHLTLQGLLHTVQLPGRKLARRGREKKHGTVSNGGGDPLEIKWSFIECYKDLNIS